MIKPSPPALPICTKQDGRQSSCLQGILGKGLASRKIIAVHKPYMTRRVFAALQKQWPEVEVIIALGNPSLTDHLAGMMADGVEEREIINSLVGDFQRMDVYAKLGYQIPQDIPPKTMVSYEALVKLGYDKYVL
jgi:uncharacterized SAM-binding protein YcdF (DUF218 family)